MTKNAPDFVTPTAPVAATGPAPAPRLQIRDLSRRFDGRAVVDGVSLSISAGQVTCLLGPSGCGKSTALRCVAGVERPHGGEIRVDGEVLFGADVDQPPEARPIGLMFQDFALFPHLTVADNIGFGLKSRRGARDPRIAQLMERGQIAHLAERYPHEISGGEQQRVALARALAPRPRVILMDEPFSGLDNRLRDGIRDDTLEILKEAGSAVLLVTHEPEEAMRMGDEIALMRAGQIVQRGAPTEIYQAPVDLEAAAFFSEINVLEGKARAGRVETPLGRLDAPGLAEGQKVDVVLRPQHVRVTLIQVGPAVPAQVLRSSFLGGGSLVMVRLETCGTVLKAQVPAMFLPRVGQAVWISTAPENCHVFPSQGAVQNL